MKSLTSERKEKLNDEIEKIVHDFYEEYPQFNTTIPNSFDAAEELGFFVVSLEGPDGVSGFTTTFDQRYYLIAVNSKETKARQNFSVWHEIYHWYTGDGKEISLYDSEDYSETEYKAEGFSAHILMNTDILKKDLDKLNLSDFKYIKNADILNLQYKFQVSTAAMIRKIVDLTGENSLWKRKKNLCKVSVHKDKGFSGELEKPTIKNYISPIFFDNLLDNLSKNKISENYAKRITDYIEEVFK